MAEGLLFALSDVDIPSNGALVTSPEERTMQTDGEVVCHSDRPPELDEMQHRCSLARERQRGDGKGKSRPRAM